MRLSHGALVLLCGLGLARRGAAAPPPARAVPDCQASQIEDWRAVLDDSLGVLAFDPVGQDISSLDPSDPLAAPPAATDNIHDWVPVDGFKTTFCGLLHHAAFFDPSGGVIVDEYDLGSHVIPLGPHWRIIVEAKRRFPDAVALCCGEKDPATGQCPEMDECVETEVTAHRGLIRRVEKWWGHEWYKDKEQVCAYGPWVIDTGHNHPEIHPMELLWVKDSPRSWVLGLIQDASSRYSSRVQFKHKHRPQGWRPWAAAPLQGEFRIAFAAAPGHPPASFSVEPLYARHVVTTEVVEPELTGADPCAGPDPSGTGIVCRDGNAVVAEVTRRPPDVVAGFVDVCRRPDRSVQGYVSFRSAVGKDECGAEGYHLLRVTEGHPPAVADSRTMRAAMGAGDARPAPDPAAPPPPSPSPSPLIQLAATVAEEKADGIAVQIGPAISRVRQVLLDGVLDPGCAPAERPASPPALPPMAVAGIREWSVRIEPHYAGSPDADYADQAMAEGDLSRAGKLLGLSGALQITPTWTVAAFDMTNAARPVALGDLKVERRRAKNGSFELGVGFPAVAGAVYKVEIDLSLTDSGGRTASVSHCLWSHAFDGGASRGLVEALLGTSLDVGTASVFQGASNPAASRKGPSHARQVLYAAAAAAKDRVITVEELRSLVLLRDQYRR